MMPSEERAYKDKIRALEHKITEQFHCAMRKAVEVVNRSEYLTEDEKKTIIEGFYK
ncbi:hypothetical protein D9M71_430970 [compost metagenome]